MQGVLRYTLIIMSFRRELKVSQRKLNTIILMFSLILPLAVNKLAASEYLLGPQDKLEIKVSDFRPGSVETRQWAPFNGDFYVAANGMLSLPLIGDVEASGRTTSAIARDIAARIQEKVGLTQSPSTSVQVTKYRPFYIVGDVEKPGEFDYRPGLNVLQALSVAGGARRLKSEDLIGVRRDTLVQKGELNLLASNRDELLIRRARLDAEINNASEVKFPPEILVKSKELEVARALREESNLFIERQMLEKSQLNTLETSKSTLSEELKTLARKDTALSRQIEILRKELQTVRDLVGRGLAVNSRELAAEQSAIQYENNKLDIQLANLRAQQEITRVNREIDVIRTARRNEALKEAADIREKFDAVQAKIGTSSSILSDIAEMSPQAMNRIGEINTLQFTVVRGSGKTIMKFLATEGDELLPGDVLKIEMLRNTNYSNDSGIKSKKATN